MTLRNKLVKLEVFKSCRKAVEWVKDKTIELFVLGILFLLFMILVLVLFLAMVMLITGKNKRINVVSLGNIIDQVKEELNKQVS